MEEVFIMVGLLHPSKKIMETEKEVETKTSRVQADGMQIPFALVQPGKEVEVISVRGKDETRKFLANLGFVEGATVSVVSENGGNVIASVKNSRVAISQTMAMRIMVA